MSHGLRSHNAVQLRPLLGTFGLLFFPAALTGSLWFVPLGASMGILGSFFLDRAGIDWKRVAAATALAVCYLAPSWLACFAPGRLCINWILEQEIYLLGVSIVMYCCAVTIPGTRPSFAPVALTAVGIYVLMAVFVLETRTNLVSDIEPPLYPLLIERNDLALLVAWVFFIFGLGLGYLKRSYVRLLLYFLVVAVAVTLSLATRSRLIAMTAILGAVWFAPFGHTRVFWLAICGALLTVFVPLEYTAIVRFVQRISSTESYDSVLTRLYLWRSGWHMFLTSPWLGNGMGSFAVLYGGDGQVSPETVGIDVRYVSWPHNVWIEVLVEKGILGLITFMALLSWIAVNLARNVPHNLLSLQKSARYLFLALMFSGFFDSSTKRLWYLPSLFYVLGISAGIIKGRTVRSSNVTALD